MTKNSYTLFLRRIALSSPITLSSNPLKYIMTETQIFLKLEPIQAPTLQEDRTIGGRFVAFHEANPHVYEALRHLAMQEVGYQSKSGIKALFEVLRWQWRNETEGDEYKLNNNFTSRYARMLMDREDELKGFFDIRGLKSE